MSKGKRFYQLRYLDTNQPMYLEDVGNTLKISGLLLQGMSSDVIILAPTAEMINPVTMNIIEPTLEEWSEILRQSDDPQYFELDETGTIKALHRKQRGAISGAIQQKMWMRDGLLCLFCGREMGDVSLTVDHFMPLELGGENDETNYITACRKCNKRKGNRHPEEYCEDQGLKYHLYVDYLNPNLPLGTVAHSPAFIADAAKDAKRWKNAQKKTHKTLDK